MTNIEDELIGKTFNNGKLKVIVVYSRGKHTTFRVECDVCSLDRELFPLGYFTIRRSDLIKGCIPCGCSRNPRWTEDQYLTLAKRAGEKSDFEVIGLAEEYRKQKTKLILKCSKNHVWESSINNIINNKSGCQHCQKESLKTPKEEVNRRCLEKCDMWGHRFLGFPDGYENAYSELEYECSIHGIQKVGYNAFINTNKNCPGCAEYGYNPNKPGSLYVVKWYNRGAEFLKFGITNREVIVRVGEQSSKTQYNYVIDFNERWEDGRIAQKLERLIKENKEFKKGVIDKKDFVFGFTETISYSRVDELLKFIRNSLPEVQKQLS